MLNPVETELRKATLIGAHNLYDIDFNRREVGAFAAGGSNVLLDYTSPTSEEEANAILGVRELWIAPIVGGLALASNFIFAANLVAGDTGPTPEAITSDDTFDNGRVVSAQTGVNNGSKTWDITGYQSDPIISLLIDHSRLFGTPEKRGKAFAYVFFNEDRSSFFGEAKVNTATSPRDVSQRWRFGIPFDLVNLRPSSQNPLASEGTIVVSGFTPVSGPVGTLITVRGTNMDNVASARLGSQLIATGDLSGQTTVQVQFAVPVGATAGDKAIVLVDGNDEEVPAGVFEVTA